MDCSLQEFLTEEKDRMLVRRSSQIDKGFFFFFFHLKLVFFFFPKDENSEKKDVEK